MPEIETVNKFLVGYNAGMIVISGAVRLRERLTPDDALLLAAWLVACAEVQASHSFDDVLKAVQST